MRSSFFFALRGALVAFLVVSCTGRSSGAGAVRHYLIKLRGEPVAAYLGRQAASRKDTMHAARLQANSSEANSYRSQLRAGHSAVKRRVESLPNGLVRGEMDTVFNGLAVTLRQEDAAALQANPEVEEIIPSVRYRKALDAAEPLIRLPEAWLSPAINGEANAGAGVRIAIIDTGIDVAHPMFQDGTLSAPAGYPRFTTATSACPRSDQPFTNSKVIVARNYVSLLDSPDPNCDAMDRDGHGTFAAGIAAGRRVDAPSGSLAGVAPRAFLGSYKVFGSPGFNDEASLEAIMQALDDAVKDGMQVVNLSLGAMIDLPPARDPLAQAVVQAVSSGITVVVAAGNEGPATGTVTSPGTSPAAITVGATTNARLFANPLTLSSSAGVPPELSTLGAVPGNGPAFTSVVGPAPFSDVQGLDGTGSACSSLPAGSLTGHMAFIRRGECNFSTKIRNAFTAGAVAAILYNNQLDQPPVLMDVEQSTQIPAAMVGNRDGLALKQFLVGSRATVEATLGPERRALATTPNRIPAFSSNGPSTDFGIKPDLVAPGSNIYSSVQRNDPDGEQYDASGFGAFSGTSFATPFVTGAAALVKQAFPNFSPSQVKSALVNTAAKVVSRPSGGQAPSVLAQGNGLLDAAAALTTVATVSPVSISFGAQSPGSFLARTATLTVTNVSSATDSFSISVTPTVGSGQLTFRLSSSNFTLPAGASQTITVDATSSVALSDSISGYISILGQNTQTSLTLPYWGTFMRPVINAGEVLNAASYFLGPAALAPGSLISIFGAQLANETAQAVTLPLPTSLGGVEVWVNDTPIPLLYVSGNQINAELPVGLAIGSTASLVVRLNGVVSNIAALSIAAAAPGIFTLDRTGRGPAAILHNSDFSFVTAENPAQRGEVLAVYATGLGAASPRVATGSPASSSSLSLTTISPSATLGETPATILFAGLAPGSVGLYQINLQVPATLPGGEQTLFLTADGVSSNPAVVFVAK